MSSELQPVSFSAPSPEQLAPGFPGYAIENLIATGGMGAVYKAIQVSLDRPVAIKILPRETSADPTFRDSFTAEAKAMARLNHPNLIGVYDFGEVDGILFIIMEYVPGQSLYHATHGQPVQSREAARLISEICAGLAHAHEHGIIHRDIKPSNILLDRQGRPKIGDFGLAHPIGRTATDGETIFGTPHYTAPEVLVRPKAVGARADIFSVGVMLHELLTSSLPDVDARPASSLCGCDSRFDAIIKKATHPVPEMRYRSAAEIAADLAPLLRVGEAATKSTSSTAAIPRPAAGGTPKASSAVTPPRALSTPVRTRPVVQRPKKNSMGLWIMLFLLLAAGVAYVLKDKILPDSSKPLSNDHTGQTPLYNQEDVPKKTDSNTTAHKNDWSKANDQSDNAPLSGFADSKHDNDTSTTRTRKSGRSDSADAKHDSTNLTNDNGVSLPKTSTFDLAAFLDRARGVMREKAQPDIQAHDKALSENLDVFLRKIKRACHHLDNNERFPSETRAEAAVDKLRANRNRMPTQLTADQLIGGAGWNITVEFNVAHREALDRQAAADTEFAAKLDALCSLYIKGLEYHIAKLKKEGDDEGAKELERESEKSLNNPRRFKNIILDRSLDDVDPDVEKVDGTMPKLWRGKDKPPTVPDPPMPPPM